MFSKTIIITLIAGLFFSSCAISQSTTGTTTGGMKGKKGPNATTNTTSSTTSALSNLTNDQMVSGLKEALSIGAQNSASKLHIADGFFKNMAIKILMPPEAKQVEEKMRALGFSAQVDQVILSMNRAAEKAAIEAAPIFINAIKTMSITDAVKILTGPNDAATQYLKTGTSAQLTVLFKPVIQKALDAVDATKYWNDVFTTYNKIPFVQPVNPDLTGYVTQKALDGLFYTIALEEAKIRANPMQTASSIVQTVFGSLLK